ncbi:MAG: methyltransferase domain-containing protein [Butyrivibrio sp.]|nr:methyltransferase domain-containing protein [Butyrivibrio sp.]
MEKILDAIQQGSWEEALGLFLEYTKIHDLNEELCVVGATILEQFDESDEFYSMIQSGLRFNLFNYELYLLLGNYYSRTNPKQALLTYKQALYYAEKSGNEDDTAVIRQMYEDYVKESGAEPVKTTVLVVADDDKKCLEECLASIDENCNRDDADVQVVTVNDVSERTLKINEAVSKLPAGNDLFILAGDVVLTPNALYNLQIELYSQDEIGAAGCISNYAFYHQVPVNCGVKTPKGAVNYATINNYPRKGAIEIKAAVDGAFVLIKREVVDIVFPLSTDFVSEGYTNIDLGLRIVEAGYKNAVCWNSFVFRYRRYDVRVKDLAFKEEEAKKTREKWGFSPEYYLNTRFELAEKIARDKADSLDVLEVGAGLGSTLARIEYMFPGARVHGIEIVDAVADFASKYTDMKCANIETYEFAEGEMYDYIIFGDVLEHLVDPYKLVDRLKNNLKPGGCIIASIPNILNANVIYELLRGNFSYQDAGILDRTHLRFFTKNEVIKLFQERGYEIIDMEGSFWPSESTAAHKEFFDKLLAIDGVVDKSEFEIIQYLVCAQKKR